MATIQTAVTGFVDASNGIRYAYRQVGIEQGTPLVMHIHYRANMDLWDPALVNALASKRPVLIFDQPGIGRTPGTVPTTFQGWADDLISFVRALGLKKIDLLGFSMGGVAVQMVALTVPQLIRRLILAGTTPALPPDEHVRGIVTPRDMASPEYLKALSEAVTVEEGKDAIAFSFFYNNEAGRAAAESYWSRLSERNAEPPNLKLLDRDSGSLNQMQSSMQYRTPRPETPYKQLRELRMPIMVMNGDNDALIPTSRSWELYKAFDNAQLVLYPQAGHGFLWQYAELVANHINIFLDEKDYDALK